MGLRGKVIVGLTLFFVVFCLRFLCANCQQVEVDLSVESSRSQPQSQPQQWRAVSTSITFSEWDKSSNDELSPNPYETWPSDETPLRRRRPGVRKRKRRPQGFTTESTERHWRGQVSDEIIHVSPTYDYEASDPVQYEFYSSPTPTKLHQRNKKLPLSAPITKFNEKIERVREPMAALEREQKLSEIREKQKELLADGVTTTKNIKSYRRPYSQVKREREENSNEFSSAKPTVDLKNILKSSGSLSLSEILQQKNLSLDDLIKGKQNALLALQTTSAAPITSTTQKNTKPVRRIPWSYLTSTLPSIKSQSTGSEKALNNRTRNISKLSTDQTALLSTVVNHTNRDEIENVVEIATKATLRDNPPLRKLSNQTIRNVVFPIRFKSTSTTTTTTTTSTTTNAPTTTTPVLELSTNRINTTIQKVHDKPVKSIEVSTFRPEIRQPFVPQYRRKPPIKPRLRVTPVRKFSSSSSSSSESSSSDSSSENKKSRARNGQETENIDSNSDSIEDKLRETLPDDNLIEKFTSLDGGTGHKMVSTNLEELFGSPIKSKMPERATAITPRIDRFYKTTSSDEFDVTERNPSLFLDLTSDRSVDDRTDILELMEDRRSGGRLFKVLAQRNMTLEELLEHRRRGSSQLHLAEIIQNKSKPFLEPAELSSPFDDSLDIVTAFENFPHFNLVNLKSINPDEIKTDSQGSSYFTSIVDIEPTDEVYKDSRSMKDPISPLLALDGQEQINLPLKASPALMTGKSNHNSNWNTRMSVASYTSQENSIDFKHGGQSHMPSNIAPPKEADVEDSAVRIEDEVARAHDLLDLELSGHGFKRSTVNIESAQMPSVIRSVIVASSAIVATSLLVFLVIFVVCRWRQKRQKKLSYVDTYNAIKSRLPIISRQAAMKRFSENSSPIIFPGSKSCKLNTMDPNSPEVQEYLFDTIRKPF